MGIMVYSLLWLITLRTLNYGKGVLCEVFFNAVLVGFQKGLAWWRGVRKGLGMALPGSQGSIMKGLFGALVFRGL